jgi:hypothetical protein
MLFLLTDGWLPKDFRCFDMTSYESLSARFATATDGWEMSPDGRVLLARMRVSNDGTLQRLARFLRINWRTDEQTDGLLYDAASGHRLGSIPGGREPLWASDGKMLAILTQYGSVAQIWNIPPPKPLGSFAVSATLFALPIGLVAWLRGRKLRAA